MREKLILLIIAIICIAVLEITALIKEVDGKILSMVIGSISFLVGYFFKNKKKRGE